MKLLKFYFKYKLLLVFLSGSLICNCIYSQTPAIDSLKLDVRAAKHDTTRINLYQLLFYSYKNISIDSSHHYAIKSLNLARFLKYEKGIAEATKQLAEYYSFISDYKNAINYYNKAISHYKNLNKELEIGKVLHQLGTIQFREGNDFESAKYYLKAIDIFEKYDNKYSLATTLSNLGSIYREQAQYKKAIETQHKALNLFIELENKERQAAVYVNIANIFSDQQQNDSALKYYLEALPNISNKLHLSKLYYNIGESYMKRGNYIKSENNYLSSLHLAEQLESEEQIELVFEGLLNLYGKWKKYERAEIYIQKILVNLKQINNKKVRQDIYDVVQNYYFQTNNIKKAYYYLYLSRALNDTIFSESSNNKLTEMEVKYETEQKKKELLNLKVQQKEKEIELNIQENQKRIAYSVTLFIIIVFGLLLMIFFQKQKTNRIIMSQKQMEFEKNNSELKQRLLRSQMNPHFIFNSIDNIQGLIHNKQDEQAIEYLDGFSKLTRQILEHSRESYITLLDEVNMIENYLSIQQLLHNHSFSYAIHISENIDGESIFLPPMLTQPFIENSIKHGLNGKTEKGQINLNFFLKNNKLFAEIIDNGTGFSNEIKGGNHKSLAMNITKERLAHYSKAQDYLIKAENMMDQNSQVIGAKVLVEIPYIYEK